MTTKPSTGISTDRTEFYASIVINADRDAVWKYFDDFANATWMPALEKSSYRDDSKNVRLITVANSGPFIEEVRLAAPKYTLRYAFLNAPFPGVSDYEAEVVVSPVTINSSSSSSSSSSSGASTFVAWRGFAHITPDEQAKYVELFSNAVYASSLKALKEKLEKQ